MNEFHPNLPHKEYELEIELLHIPLTGWESSKCNMSFVRAGLGDYFSIV